MGTYEISERVVAMAHTQKAIDVLSSLILKGPEIHTMLHHLEAVRKELAYEIFRAK